MTLLLCELGEAHDIGCLGGEAVVEHCFGFALAEMDADCRCAHVVDFFDSGGEFVKLVAVEGMAESKAVIGLIGG